MEVMANLNIICQDCGQHNRLERNIFEDGERIRLVCSGCEIVLKAEFRKPVDRQPDPEYSFGYRGI